MCSQAFQIEELFSIKVNLFSVILCQTAEQWRKIPQAISKYEIAEEQFVQP